MVSSKDCWTGRIEMGIGDYEFLALVTPSVMPHDGPTVAIETASCGIAPSPWAEEVDSRASQ